MAGLMLTAEAPLDYLRDNWEDIPRILLMGAVITLFISLATLAVSTFTTRRAIAAAIIIGGYILLNGVSDGLTFAENCIDQQAGFGARSSFRRRNATSSSATTPPTSACCTLVA